MAAGALLVFNLIVGAPLARANNHDLTALAIYASFSKVCHQLPERSFFIGAYPLAVCARCTGLYGGFTAALLIYPLVTSLERTFTPPRKWLVLAALPMLIDVGVNLFGIWTNTHTSRLVTGALLGVVAVFYVMPGVSDLALHGLQLSSGRKKLPALTRNVPDQLSTAPSDYSAPHRRI